MDFTIIFAALIVGFAAGLRALTAPAVVVWAAILGSLNLGATPFSFMASPFAVGILTVMALGEYVADLLPSTPNRTSPPGLIARFITGSFSAACLLAATGKPLAYCLLGGAAAVGGAFAGFHLRTILVSKLDVSDAFIAVPEDLFAIGLAFAAIVLI